jgi:hypothetical protein
MGKRTKGEIKERKRRIREIKEIIRRIIIWIKEIRTVK